jgi:hypothetical protein
MTTRLASQVLHCLIWEAERSRWAMQCLERLLLKMWANGSFLFSKLDIKSSQSDPAVMVQLREEATGSGSFAITAKPLSIISEGTTEKCEYLHKQNKQGNNKQQMDVSVHWGLRNIARDSQVHISEAKVTILFMIYTKCVDHK